MELHLLSKETVCQTCTEIWLSCIFDKNIQVVKMSVVHTQSQQYAGVLYCAGLPGSWQVPCGLYLCQAPCGQHAAEIYVECLIKVSSLCLLEFGVLASQGVLMTDAKLGGDAGTELFVCSVELKLMELICWL